jgi:uncharacterized membrane protein YccF (DUF307 family)
VNFLHFLLAWKALTHLFSAVAAVVARMWVKAAVAAVRITPPTLQQIQQM